MSPDKVRAIQKQSGGFFDKPEEKLNKLKKHLIYSFRYIA